MNRGGLINVSALIHAQVQAIFLGTTSVGIYTFSIRRSSHPEDITYNQLLLIYLIQYYKPGVSLI